MIRFELIKGLIISIMTAFIITFIMTIQAGIFNWKVSFLSGLAAGLAYFLKNLFVSLKKPLNNNPDSCPGCGAIRWEPKCDKCGYHRHSAKIVNVPIKNLTRYEILKNGTHLS